VLSGIKSTGSYDPACPFCGSPDGETYDETVAICRSCGRKSPPSDWDAPKGRRPTTVYFDLETGGVEPGNPNIQVAAVAVDNRTWRELGVFEKKIQFLESECDPEALKINHYDPKVWEREAVPERAALYAFSKFLDQYKWIEFISKRTNKPYYCAKLCGHNAATFDGVRIKYAFKRHDMFLPADPRVRCTAQRAIWWFDEHDIKPADYKLGTLCEYFGITADGQAHDALTDVRLDVQLARRLADPTVPGRLI
jgi:DNA polymerase III epsilon subunit-like protein